MQVVEKSGAPWVIRTPDLLLRRQTLYPAELRAHSLEILAQARVKHPPSRAWNRKSKSLAMKPGETESSRANVHTGIR